MDNGLSHRSHQAAEGHKDPSTTDEEVVKGHEDVVVAVALEERENGSGAASSAPASPPAPAQSLLHSAVELNVVSRAALLLSFCVGVTFTMVLATLALTQPTWFVDGALSVLQMTAIAFSVAAVAFRGFVAVGLWRDATSAAFLKNVDALVHIAAALLLFFLCDRTTLLRRRDKEYNTAVFWSIVGLFFLAGAFTIKKVPPPKSSAQSTTATAEQAEPAESGEGGAAAGQRVAPAQPGLLLNRYQTNEWKGWMQMLFLWYHYFHNVYIYNYIRLLIAAYVWMTGFGNFTYYYNREDFSLVRFLGMMWRLNMFVIGVCAVLDNQYMLYYICPLHTFFTLTVYVALLLWRAGNRTKNGILIKFAVSVGLCAILWDMSFSKVLFRTVFRPIQGLIRFDHPINEAQDIYHEWFFRSFLDHYIWIVGMLVAYVYPQLDGWLVALDTAPHGTARRRALAIKWSVALGAAAVFAVHCYTIMRLPKFDYNAFHPYTSWVPLMAFLVLRNISRRVRGYYVGLFEWFGRITLETYIAQYHIWMATTGANGSPKKLLCFIPGDYPLCDFVVSSIFMFYLSYRVCLATDTLKAMMFPPKASEMTLWMNLLSVAVACASFGAVLWVWQFYLLPA